MLCYVLPSRSFAVVPCPLPFIIRAGDRGTLYEQVAVEKSDNESVLCFSDNMLRFEAMWPHATYSLKLIPHQVARPVDEEL